MLSKINALIPLLLILHVKCSRVIDNQQGLYVSDYCPEIGACTEGSHVMCTHYNPNKTMGHLCAEYENVTMTEEYADILLGLLNGVRSRVARGLEKGKQQQTLPRGYGMFKLQWDPELATLAQLWANQCIIDADKCRATKKFADPGQLLVVTLFTDPDWSLLSKREVFKTPGYSLEKIKYSLESSVHSWYTTKNWVGSDAILGHKWNKDIANNQFLQIIQGSATHVGCGISVFKSFIYFQYTQDLIFNVVRVVCNFSIRIREGGIYTTDPPTAVGYTMKCGCPLGYDEDPDCLCYETGRELQYLHKETVSFKYVSDFLLRNRRNSDSFMQLPAFSCRYGVCHKPNVVVLPIFTVENAPPHKLMEKEREQESNTELIKRDEIDHDGLLSRRRIKPSVFSKSSIFILPTRKLKQGITKIDRNSTTPWSNSINYNKTIHFNEDHNINGVYNKINKKSNQKQNRLKKSDDDSRRNLNKETDLNHFMEEHDSNSTNSRLSTKNLGVSEQNKIIDILNKLEIVSKYIKLDKSKIDIIDKKIQKIYKTFLNKIKLRTNEDNHDDFNFDYKPEKLYQYEDQVNRIKEYNNVFEIPLKDKENIAINEMKRDENENSYSLKNSKLKDIRKTYNMRGRIEYKDIENDDDDLIEDDLLSLNKRTYYQNKLNNLERKIRRLRKFNSRKEVPDNYEMQDMPTFKWRHKRPNIET